MTSRTEQPPPSSGPPSRGRDREAGAPRTARQRRDDELRATLRPLEPGERPPALLAAVALAALLAVAVALGTASIHDLSRHGGSIPGGIFLSALLLALAVAMYRRRYWALVGFEALLVFQMLAATLGLVLAANVYVALGCVLALALGGLLFWKLIRVMGRLQAGQIEGESAASCDRVDSDG